MAKAKQAPPPEPDEWSEGGFISAFMEIHHNAPERAFAFVLGSGASVTSGIPTAAPLARKWVEELYERDPDKDPEVSVEEWATAAKLDINGFDMNDIARSYPDIYDRRFHDEPELGYAYLEDEIGKGNPNVGYSFLAQILAKTQHNLVITTNFDNLVAKALSVFTDTFPLECGHESLTAFVPAKLRRPLIAKIHRDVLLAPMSRPAETSTLPIQWEKVLYRLLKNYTPIFIGYGGNDGSLMGFLETLNKADIAGRVYWCYRRDDGKPNERIRCLVGGLGGVIIGITGFDELMLQLGERLGYPVPHEQIEESAKERARRYREQVKQFTSRLKPGPVRKAFEATVDRQRSWWTWELKARAEKDPTKAEAIYGKGLEEFPESHELMGNFANFLCDVRKDYDEAERLYRKALKREPDSATNLGNFAVLLKKVRKDYDEAERLYRKALDLEPDNTTRLGNFANFLYDVRKDYDEAERFYRKALELEPDQATNLGNFAVFLSEVRKDYDEAERLYRKALEVEPHDANKLGNFAGFLLGRTRVEESRPLIAAAWKANDAEVRQLAAEIALYWCLDSQIEGRDDAPGLARLKYLLATGFLREDWSFGDVLAAAREHMTEETAAFYRALADAILDEKAVPRLAEFDRWKEVIPISIEETWDM